jgi:hypothetical protein
MQIAGRGFQVRVPQQSLNHQQVHAVVQQMRGKRVAQRMRMNRLGDPAAAPPSANLKTLWWRWGNPAFRREKPVGGTFPAPVGGQHFAQRLRQHDLPVFVAFAAANPDHMAFAIQVGHLQVVTSDTRSPAPYIVARIARCLRFFGASSSALTSACSE